MTYIRKNISHITSRIIEELKATYEIAQTISWRAAFVTLRAKFDIQRMSHNGFRESENEKNRLLVKHKVMMEFLENKFKYYWDSYKRPTNMFDCAPRLRNKIWICWWQGLDEAPEIVKLCVDSIRRNAGKYEIILITDKNYKDYVAFPDYVEEKRKNGIISRTIYSDLLRVNLLSKYGGIWIDSTFFCTKPCFDTYMQLPLWSIKRPDYLHCSVAGGYFANYSFGCSYDNRWIFQVIFDLLCSYWKENDILIDYLLTDYVIVLAQQHDKQIADAFSRIQPNNKWCDELYKVLGRPFDSDRWRLICKDTCLFKLTWKQDFAKRVGNKETFYGKLYAGTLN